MEVFRINVHHDDSRIQPAGMYFKLPIAGSLNSEIPQRVRWRKADAHAKSTHRSIKKTQGG
ncbi:MAG: hypothetical protein A3I66_09870 [Burkholderiales bacterium RIFCSPLOWO2_02_FULL_57_36]|nr:MAG: hypothetical protein A3I66_09870 [Burkholderiales bacterium RIFCSPLOWO2_02_FULL_57_36]